MGKKTDPSKLSLELVSRGDDGSELVVTHLTIRSESIDRDKRTVDFVASTDAVDSYGEIVEQIWRLERFLANPVILYSHDSRALPIGKAIKVAVVDVAGRPQLHVTIQFSTAKANPLAENVWQSILEETLRAVSVGFVPNEYRWEKREGQDVLVLSDNELHEISVVTIPANPEALAKMRARAAKHRQNAAGDGEGTIDMNLEEALKKNGELEARASQAESARTTLEKENTTLKTSLKAVETELETTAKARDEAVKRAKSAEATVVEGEVEALIGKKLLPAEREGMVELATNDLKLFRKLMAQRPALNLDAPVMKSGNGETENKSSTVTRTSASEDLAGSIFEEGEQ